MSSQGRPEHIAPLAEVLATAESRALVDQLALFFERFGFRRNLGRIWATLFLSATPLSQQQLSDYLELSAGLVSSGLKELDHFEMIATVTQAGQRRAFYRAEARLLRIVAAILSKREVPAVEALHEAVRGARQAYLRRSDVAHLPPRLRAVEEAARLYSALARVVMLIARLPAATVGPAIRLIEALRFGDDRRDVKSAAQGTGVLV